MNLHNLLNGLVDINFGDQVVLGLENDSRAVSNGSLFLAYPGAVTDGRKYIDNAVANGAVAVLYDSINFNLTKEYAIPVIPINNLKNKLADIAAHYYAYPTKSLNITGVTGTNGKTTIAYQLAKAYDLLGEKSAYIGTIGQGEVNSLQEIANTTPDGILLQKLFHEYKNANVKHVCMEVSSHALSERRVNNVNFEQAIYTNLSHEHLDFHHTMEEYASAKAKLFAVESLRNIVINTDDAYAQVMLNACSNNILKTTYGINNPADFNAIECISGIDGSEFTIKSKDGEVRIAISSIGTFNVYNCLAIFASLRYYGFSIQDVRHVIEKLTPVSGRMELITKYPYVFVDYSHTPDALENALVSLVNINKQTKNPGNIWVIFGCGGDRDATKRPIMGAVACKYADVVIITSDNPRTEDPDKIISDISKGISEDKGVLKISNRKEAILYAIDNAKNNDIILIAGKGHEDYQIIGREKFDFSDKEIVKNFIEIS